MHNARLFWGRRPFFFGPGPFVGGVLGGLLGSALIGPRPFYPPFYPYGGFGYGGPFFW
ncbi:hypothetical protein OEV98_04365 [Caldibacillus lycopersici]|uniref:Uncharacterized protein n=1 Tax=Perspicuibacillus lycopersici TaxID=1325689 RepID=A0AAE3IQX3_9BACI|nr:hypothetical protein [Perspicuibacillus lycopersici]MCU9612781.1 hypothetical protein [Perspicuibacillus lycopersici]